jgi:hypothetical protein
MRRLVEQIQATGAQLLLLTPPMFDPTPLTRTSEEGGVFPYPGYDRVLAQYSQWLLAQRQNGWAVADVHGAMNGHVAARRGDDPRFILAGDGVHANAFGHWLMARQVLSAWGVPAEAGGAGVDLDMLRAARGHITDLKADAGIVSFTWRSNRPMPIDDRWDASSQQLDGVVQRFNRFQLAITGLPAGQYHLFEGETLVATLGHDALATGVNLLGLRQLSLNQGAEQLLEMVGRRQRLLADAWLTAVGHQRPGLPPGQPLDQAQREADEMAQAIRTLAGPLTLKLRLVPAGEPRTPQAADQPGHQTAPLITANPG